MPVISNEPLNAGVWVPSAIWVKVIVPSRKWLETSDAKLIVAPFMLMGKMLLLGAP